MYTQYVLTPQVVRAAIQEWDREVERVGGVVLDLIGEGLGLSDGRLRELTCLEGRTLVGHYYPPCPQPELTVGLAAHADPGALTVLLQDHIGGLQIRSSAGVWVDVKPVPGAIVINVGDLLQVCFSCISPFLFFIFYFSTISTKKIKIKKTLCLRKCTF